MALALSTEKLTKIYSNQLKALIGVNIKVEKGDFFALLGSNGAGKTTAIGIICGLLKSTSGSVKINGLDQKEHVNKIKRMIGLMPQEFNFNPHEPNIEILINQAGYFGIARTEAKIQAEDGIRDHCVTGVQTCALPICLMPQEFNFNPHEPNIEILINQAGYFGDRKSVV